MAKSGDVALDLGDDAAAFARFLARAANRYRKAHREPVTGIDVFYAMQNGFADVYFWTDPTYEPFERDAKHARMAETLKRPRWERFHKRSFDVPLTVRASGGKRLQTRPDRSDPELRARVGGVAVVKAIGTMIGRALVTAMRDDTFARLPRAQTVTLSVQDDDDEVYWSKRIKVPKRSTLPSGSST